MIVSDPRLISIARYPEPDPQANALKTGTPADYPRVPEDAANINARTREWFDNLKPQNYFHCWLVDQAVLHSLRIEHVGRVERRLRDRAAFRAERYWDQDRRLEAEQLGLGLDESPAFIVDQLKRTPHGCDWLMVRWAALARIAHRDDKWDADQQNLAYNLLGIRREERTNPLGETIDLDGKLAGAPVGLVELANRQVAELLKQKEEVAPLDALDRTMAMADYDDEPTPEIRRLRRRDAELHRRLKWCLAQIDHQSPHQHTRQTAQSYYRYLCDPEPVPPAEVAAGTPPAPTQSTPPPEPEPEPEVEAVEEPMILPRNRSDRREGRDRKADARREAKRRKNERKRA